MSELPPPSLPPRPPPPPPPSPAPSPSSGPPEGWYSFEGHQRWWDGRAWGPYAPASTPGATSSGSTVRWPQDDGRTVAVVGHAGAFVLPVIAALVVQQTEGRRSEFVKHHAAEAFNFQLTMTLLAVANVLVAISLTPATMGAWIIAVVPIHLGIAASVVGFSIVAAIAARRGEWYQYPVSLRVLPGARPQP